MNAIIAPPLIVSELLTKPLTSFSYTSTSPASILPIKAAEYSLPVIELASLISFNNNYTLPPLTKLTNIEAFELTDSNSISYLHDLNTASPVYVISPIDVASLAITYP